MTERVLSVAVKLKADGSGLVGQSRASRAEIEALGVGVGKAGEKAAAMSGALGGAATAADGLARANRQAAGATETLAERAERFRHLPGVYAALTKAAADAAAANGGLAAAAGAATAAVAGIGAGSAGRELSAQLSAARAATEALGRDARGAAAAVATIGAASEAAAADQRRVGDAAREASAEAVAAAGRHTEALERILRAEQAVREAHGAVAAAGGTVQLERGESVTLTPGGGARTGAADAQAAAAATEQLAQARRELAAATEAGERTAVAAAAADRALASAAAEAASAVAGIGAGAAGREIAAPLGAAGAAAEALAADARAAAAALDGIGAGAGVDRLGDQLSGAGAAARQLEAGARQAAAASESYASDLARLRAAIDPVGEAERQLARAIDLADTALARGDLTLEQHAAALARAQAAGRGHAVSLGQQRQSLQQVGQQFGDFTLQVSTGQSVATAFAQQIGQLTFAMQGLGGRMASVGAFLGGPWGIAATIALTALAPFVGKLFESDDAARKALDGLREFEKKELDLPKLIDKATGSLRDQTFALRELGRVAEQVLPSRIADATETAKEKRNDAFIAAREYARQQLIAGRRDGTLEGDIARAGGSAISLNDAIQKLVPFRSDPAFAAMARTVADATAAQVQAIGEVRQLQGQLFTARTVNAGDAILTPDSIRRAVHDGLADTPVERAQAKVRATDAELDRIGALPVSAEQQSALARAKANYEAAEKALKDAQKTASEARTQARAGTLTPFLSPVDGARVSGRYGEGRANHPNGHEGIDYAVPVGTPVRAPAAGTVDVAGERHGYGNAIYINFGGGTSARFGHLSKFNVKPGDTVEAGEIIGYTGGAEGAPGSGNSKGPHLHYEVRQGDHAIDPTKGVYRTDAGAAADDAQRRADAAAKARVEEQKRQATELAQFGKQAAASIASLNGEFGAQPTLIERSRAAVAELDAISAELEKRKPPNYAELQPQLAAARAAAADIDRPVREFVAAQREAYQIGQLQLAGQDDQADALRTILELERTRGPLTEQQKAAVLATTQALRAQGEAIERNRQRQQQLLGAVEDVRRTVADTILDPGSLKDLPGKILGSFKQAFAEELTEDLFGDTFRKLKGDITGQGEVEDASARMAGAVDQVAAKTRDTGNALDELGGAARRAVAGLAGAPAGTVGAVAPVAAVLAPESWWPGEPAGGDGAAGAVAGVAADLAEASGQLGRLAPSVDRFDGAVSVFNRAGRGLGQALDQLVNAVFGGNSTAGGKLGAQLGNVAEGVAYFQLAKGISDGLSDAAGLKERPLGGNLGFLPNLLASVFAPVSHGTASVTSGEAAAVTGTSGDYRTAASGLAGSVQDQLGRIAEQLNARLGQFSVAIGTFDDKFRVNTNATSASLHYKNFDHSTLFDFGKDEGAAISFAIADAIKDGAIEGLSQAQQLALRSSDDIDKALTAAIKVGQLELDLGGVQGAIDKLFTDFDRTAAERVELARKYGLDLLKVTELNEKQRADLIEKTLSDRVSALQDLAKNIEFGDLFEGTAAERRSAILGEIADAKNDADAGVEGASDKLAALYRQLIDTSREAFGTAGGEYADDRAAALAGLQQVIQEETGRINSASAVDPTPAIEAGNTLANEANDLLARLGTSSNQQTAVLEAMLAAMRGGNATPNLSLVSR